MNPQPYFVPNGYRFILRLGVRVCIVDRHPFDPEISVPTRPGKTQQDSGCWFVDAAATAAAAARIAISIIVAVCVVVLAMDIRQ
eukprot:2551552-Ditylum_brightwellii.AAC.1